MGFSLKALYFVTIFGLALPVFASFSAFAKIEKTYKICDSALNNEVDLTLTEQLISYLQRLFDDGVLTIAHLQKIVDGFEKDSLAVNPLAGVSTTSSVFYHAENLAEYFKNPSLLNQDQIKQWAAVILEQKKESQLRQEKSLEATKDTKMKAIFHEMPAGQFEVNTENGVVSINVEKPFAMMSTVLTKWMDIEISRINHVHGKIYNPYFSVSENVIWNLPVSNMRWLNAEGIIEVLNKYSNSEDPNVQSDLRNMIPQHQPGDIYDLPTVQQIIAVRTDYGHKQKLAEKEVKHLYWFRDNSNQDFHEVGELSAEYVQGHDFYDLAGNVNIFIKNTAAEVSSLGIPLTVTQTVEAPYREAIITGGYYRSELRELKALRFESIHGYINHHECGLRLVRYRK